MKNRTMLGIVCIVLAIAVMFGITPLVSRISTGKITVIQVKQAISQGKMITADDIIPAEIGKKGVPESVVREEKDIVGKYAKSDLYPQINITPAMLSDQANNAQDVFRSLDGKQVAVSISVPSFAAALSAKLENGDIVSVMVTDDSGTRVPGDLTYVRVITTTTAAGVDKDELQPDEDGNVDLPTTVTLLASPSQAKSLANFEAEAKMHLTLVYRGDAAAAQKFLDAQEKALSQGGAEHE